MKIYGYSNTGKDKLLELSEATISAEPEKLREIATFLLQCAEGIEKSGKNWEHEHFSSGNKNDDEETLKLVVYNPDAV